MAFAALLVAFGVWGLAERAFIAIWAPGVQPAALGPIMVTICSAISIIGGAGIAAPRFAAAAARLLLLFLCIWLVWCKGLILAHEPLQLGSWESLGETAVVTSAAWALVIMFKGGEVEDRRRLVGPRSLFGLALIAFGASHVGYLAVTASLVPKWLPWPVAWVYLTAATYIVAGTALVSGRYARPAAALSALQMAMFSVLVWLPKIAAGASDAGTLNEAGISFALAASGWVIAAALRFEQPQTYLL